MHVWMAKVINWELTSNYSDQMTVQTNVEFKNLYLFEIEEDKILWDFEFQMDLPIQT